MRPPTITAVHVCVPQELVGYEHAAELPEQEPLHTEWLGSEVHAARGERGDPLTNAHVPAALHASHCPVHAVVQQMPSGAHDPEAQSVPLTHDLPKTRAHLLEPVLQP